MAWHSIVTSIALLLVIEGLLPFAAPQRWRNMMQQIALMPDRALRISGLSSMLLGVVLLYWLS
ncbi:MAG: DUF2065 domain-containing protein [Gammaproteobacteria bacterium]|nr:DUF2065 domain-containing protein [Gammaproteobacteria bacterium]